jgi:hypothetical protein
MTEMQDFFRKTGAQGGRKRAANMTREERSESARRAVLARWAKKKKTPAKVRSAKAKAKAKAGK